MTKTFKELLDERRVLHERKAVFDHVLTDLEQYLPDDDNPPEQTITVEEHGTVSPEVVQEVIDIIKTEYITPLKEAIDALENLEIPDEEEESPEESSAPEGTGQSSGKKDRKAGTDRRSAGGGQPGTSRVQIRTGH